MVYRSKDLNIITDSQYSYLFRQMSIQRIRKVEPLDNAFQVARPHVLGEAIRMLVDHGVCTRSQIEQRLALNLRDVESLCGLPEGFLDTKVVPMKFRAENAND